MNTDIWDLYNEINNSFKEENNFNDTNTDSINEELNKSIINISSLILNDDENENKSKHKDEHIIEKINSNENNKQKFCINCKKEDFLIISFI